MANTTGTIKRLTDKGFGFIAAPDGDAPEGAFAGEIVSQIFLGAVTRVRIEGSSGEGELTADLPTSRVQELAVGAAAIPGAASREAA